MRYIYALCGPDGGIRYIGRSNRKPGNRSREHARETELGYNRRKHRWIRELSSIGIRPVVRTLAIVEDGEVTRIELGIIDSYSRMHPFRLTNEYGVAELSREEIEAAQKAESITLIRKLYT